MLIRSMEHEFKLKSYQSIFQDYIPFFVEPIDNNVGGVAMFVKNDYKVCETRGLLGHLLDTAIRCLRQKGWEKMAGCREITVSLNVSMK